MNMNRAVILDHIRDVLHILNRSQLFRNVNDGSLNIVQRFKEVQHQIRCEEKLSGSELLSPFFLLLSWPALTSPYLICALSAMKGLIQSGSLEWVGVDEICITEMISAVTGCKFQHTDVSLDGRCHVEVALLLRLLVERVPQIVKYKCYQHLIEYCLRSVDGSRHFEVTLMLLSTGYVGDVLFHCVDKLAQEFRYRLVDSSEPMYQCLHKLIGYCLRVLQSRRLGSWYDLLTESAARPKFIHHEPLIHQTTNVTLSLDIIRIIIVNLISSPSFQQYSQASELGQLVIVELGYCIIELAQNVELSDDEFRGVTRIFSIIAASENFNIWKTFIGNFVVQVYIKSITSFYSFLMRSVGSEHPFHASYPDAVLCDQLEIMSPSRLAMIIESLSDVLSQSSFLISLFCMFDSNMQQLELVRPLVGVVCQCSSLILTIGIDGIGSFKDAGLAIVQSYKQLLQSCWLRKSISSSVDISTLNVDSAESIRHRSIVFEASKKFMNKAADCFALLQSESLLPTPATPRSIATFLRHCNALPKDKVGCYLGELGKSDPVHETEGIDFHSAVLREYVSSFRFFELDILSCLRLFLSNFRLPGEAQQIDRILVAFAEHCHLHSRDSSLKIVENAEVTYLLLFSIIMLNTDRHNPNIRPERKMTLDQFVRNNIFYGKEVNQSVPIPREYLEKIYHCIDRFPIRTENRQLCGVFTIEEWLDQNFLSWDHSNVHQPFAEDFSLFAQMLDSVAMYLIFPGCAVHFYNIQLLREREVSVPLEPRWKPKLGQLANIGDDFLQESLGLCCRFGQFRVVDFVVCTLHEACFSKKCVLIDNVLLYVLCSVDSSCNVLNQLRWTFTPFVQHTELLNCAISRFSDPSIQKSTVQLLLLCRSFAQHLTCWGILISLLCLLRDVQLIPIDMVKLEDDDTCLPNDRFDQFVKKRHPRLLDQVDESDPKQLTTLQMLGEALFGKTVDEPADTLTAAYLAFQLNNPLASSTSGYDVASPLSSFPLQSMRSLIADSSILNIFQESKFLPDCALVRVLQAVVLCISRFLGIDTTSSQEKNRSIRSVWDQCTYYERGVQSLACSAASAIWMEGNIIDIAMRNRDRFSLIWPILRSHYLNSILDRSLVISRISLVQIIGLFKIASRMLPRESFTASIFEIISKSLLIESCGTTNGENLRQIVSSNADQSPLIDQAILSVGAFLQRSSGALSKLSFHQWEVIFAIISKSSQGDKFCAMKSYEICCWLLHEPLVLPDVPIFSVFAIKHLVINHDVSIDVNIGAIQLIMQVLLRLQFFIQSAADCDSNVDDFDVEDNEYCSYPFDTGVSALALWKTAWLPVMKTLYAGHSDSRRTVRCSCLRAIEYSFQQAHINSVPVAILMEFLLETYLPSIQVLFERDTMFDTEKVLAPQMAILVSPLGTSFPWVIPTDGESFEGFLTIAALQLLSKVLTNNAESLASHPKFDKLWLQSVNVFIAFSKVVETQSTSCLLLKQLLQQIKSSKIFSSRKGLGVVTKDFILQIDEPQYKQELLIILE